MMQSIKISEVEIAEEILGPGATSRIRLSRGQATVAPAQLVAIMAVHGVGSAKDLSFELAQALDHVEDSWRGWKVDYSQDARSARAADAAWCAHLPARGVSEH